MPNVYIVYDAGGDEATAITVDATSDAPSGSADATPEAAPDAPPDGVAEDGGAMCPGPAPMLPAMCCQGLWCIGCTTSAECTTCQEKCATAGICCAHGSVSCKACP